MARPDRALIGAAAGTAEGSARLDHLQILSDSPDRLAGFYRDALAMTAQSLDGHRWLCTAPARRVLIAPGAPRTLGFAAYRAHSEAALAAIRERLDRHGQTLGPSPTPLFGREAFSMTDPDGNTLVFGHGARGRRPPGAGPALDGRLQHVVFASDDPERLLAFYTRVVGAALSDKVLHNGALLACWLRTDREHHALAVFRSRTQGQRLDHYSYEVRDWGRIRDWADHFARRGITLEWGPGRHGPGNNLFIMIRDPDGNLVEFSAELEIVADDRPVGIWPHEDRTFNMWGAAPLRT